MSKIVRKNDHSNPPRKVGECLYRNRHGVYFAWFSVRGKQVKRSLKTNEKELARRRLGGLRKSAVRLHGSDNRNLRLREDALALLKLRKNSPIPFANFRQSFEMIGDGQRRSNADDDSGENPSAAGANSSAFEWAGLF